jgi:serralysin
VGTYTVSFSGSNIVTTSKQVTIGSLNVKVDLVDPVVGTSAPLPPPPPPPTGTQSLTGTSASETLVGTSGNDTISGLGGSDTLSGNAGADIIDGGTGNDYINGGLGADVLTGGSGYDAFVFDVAASSGIDRIMDFSHFSDTIRVENAVFTALPVGQLLSGSFYSGAAAHDATDRIIYNPATGALTYDPDGTGAAAAVQFAQLGSGLYVTSTDFYVT